MGSFRFAYIFLFLSLSSINASAQNDPLQKILKEWPLLFDTVLQNKSAYRLQIVYSQIDRDAKNKPTLKTYTLDVDSYYYYCASMVKLTEIPLAMEKANRLRRHHVSIYDSINIPEFYCEGLNDYLLRRRYTNASLAQFIKEMFLVSNNESFNPLYDFLTQAYYNKRLKELGFNGDFICNRMAPCDSTENRTSNPIEILQRSNGSIKYIQPTYTNPVTPAYHGRLNPFVGKAVLEDDGKLTNAPKDFTHKNYVKLSDLHTMLTRLIFPSLQPPRQKLNLNDDDYSFLRKYMGMFPRESVYPLYAGKDYPDNKMKYFIGLDSSGIMPSNIRVFNKVGMAYGFVTDCSYFVDTLNDVEFFLSASIYVNKNEILNDGVYEYESVALPFFQNLCSAIYLYEINRPKRYKPKFYDWDFEDGVY